MPQVSIPQKGDIKFDVVCDNKGILLTFNSIQTISSIHQKRTEWKKEMGGVIIYIDFFKVIYRVSGAYELPYISGVRNINWHAEKHITRQKDNVLIRIENV